MPIFDPLFLCVQKACFNQRKTWFLCAQNPTLKVLEKQELVKLGYVEGYRKNKYIYLTEKGREICQRKVEPLIQTENAAFSRLTEKEQVQLVALTRKYSDALKEESAGYRKDADV